MGWRRGERVSSEAWDTYQDSLKAEVQLWFGEEDDLHAWHTLCRAIGITHPPHKCDDCAKASTMLRLKMDDPDILIARSSNPRKHRRFNPMGSGRAYGECQGANVSERQIASRIYCGYRKGLSQPAR